MQVRVIEKDSRFYPQYYNKGFLECFKGWRFFEDTELCLNGIYTTLEKCNLSYPKLEWAQEYLTNKTEIIYE